MTLQDFIRTYAIDSSAIKAKDNPNFLGDTSKMDHWIVELKRDRKTMTTRFSMGSGHHGAKPTTEDVLNALALDSSGYDNAGPGNFEEWASEYGIEYDRDCHFVSKKRAESLGLDCEEYYEAHGTYEVVGRQAKRLKEFLGPDAYKELLYETEGL